MNNKKDYKGVVPADDFEFLRNGAMVLERRPLANDQQLEVVLAYRGKAYHDPYVTWIRRKDDGACFSGRYTRDLGTAVQDYEIRD